MRICRLHCPDLREGQNRLSAEETHHALIVLRLPLNSPVVLFDGRGREGQGTVAAVHKHAIEVEVRTVTERPFELRHHLTLAVAMTKAHRQSYLIEKCTELGAAAFWPILTEHSVAHPREAAVEKWARRAVEAAKQSHRAWVPTVDPPRTLAEALLKTADFDAAVAADVEGPHKCFLDVLTEQPQSVRVLIFIGPEGGWSNEERVRFRAKRVTFVTLSPAILRTETAAVAACAIAANQSVERERHDPPTSPQASSPID